MLLNKHKKRICRSKGYWAVLFLCLFNTLQNGHPAFASAETLSETDPFTLVSEDESLQNDNRFVVLDDFRTGRLSDKKEFAWTVKAAPRCKVKLTVPKKDGRSSRRGSSLEVEFKLPAMETIYLNKSLNHIDISQAKAFLFRTKSLLAEGEPSRRLLTLTMTDRSLQKREVDLTNQLLLNRPQWTTVVVPMSSFQGLDLDQLLMLSLRIHAGGSGLEGAFMFDEISFFGPPDLNFESSRDNIYDFPKVLYANEKRQELLKISSTEKLLMLVAEDTWQFFENSKNKKMQLIVDNIKVSADPMVSGYTSPTNIAMDLLAIISARELGFISAEKALFKAQGVISTLAQMKKHKGFFFNFYETKNLLVTRPYVSTVDNGWLAASLIIVRQALPELSEPVSEMLSDMDFNEFYDTETNQLVIGYDVPQIKFGGNHYGMLVSEARATSLLAIGKGDIPEEHWWFLYRTPPAVWKWQSQTPQGIEKTRSGVDYFQGYYEHAGIQFVPSWGGSLFEYLMPALVLDEKNLAKKGLGLNNRRATELQIHYALVEKKYPVWGISPCSGANGKTWKYEEYGVKSLGVKGYPDKGVITPHVSFLALDTLPDKAVENIRNLLKYETYGQYGFYDSLDIRTMKANEQYLSLDQGMVLTSICNYLNNGYLKKMFHQDPVGRKAEPLLNESFFKE